MDAAVFFNTTANVTANTTANATGAQQQGPVSVPGLLAALGAPLAMTLGFIAWEKAWIGSAMMLNIFKCSLASCFFLVAIGIFAASESRPFFPVELTGSATVSGMLLLSSVAGIVVGDNTWLRALQLLGTRRLTMVDMLKPFMAAFAGAIFLGEPVTPWMAIGCVTTTIGVLVVSLEREKPAAGKPATEKDQPDGERKEDGGAAPSAGAESPQLSPPSDAIVPVDALVAGAAIGSESELDSTSPRGDPAGPSNAVAITAAEAITISTDASALSSAGVANKQGGGDELRRRPPAKAAESTPPDIGTTTTTTTTTTTPGTSSSKSTTANDNACARCSRIFLDAGLAQGYLLAVLNVALDVLGSTLTKFYAKALTSWDINLVRFGSAALILGAGVAATRTIRYAGRAIVSAQRSSSAGRQASSAGGGSGDGSGSDRDDATAATGNKKNSSSSRHRSSSSSSKNKKGSTIEFPTISLKAWAIVSLGVVLVTFLCPAMSQYALFELEMATAITLNSLTPIYALPIVFVFKKERPTWRGVLGALVAVAGVPMLAYG